MNKEIVNYKGHNIEYGCVRGDCGWMIDGHYGILYFTLDGAKEDVDEWIEEEEYLNSLPEEERKAYDNIGNEEYPDKDEY